MGLPYKLKLGGGRTTINKPAQAIRVFLGPRHTGLSARCAERMVACIRLCPSKRVHHPNGHAGRNRVRGLNVEQVMDVRIIKVRSRLDPAGAEPAMVARLHLRRA